MVDAQERTELAASVTSAVLANADNQQLMASPRLVFCRTTYQDRCTAPLLSASPPTSFAARRLHCQCDDNNNNNNNRSTDFVHGRYTSPSFARHPEKTVVLFADGFRPFWETVSPSGPRLQPRILVFFSHDAGYTVRRAPDSRVGSGATSIIFICAFSDNVPEIVRTLYNCPITTNDKVRRLRESPPLRVLWLSVPKPDGGGSTTPSGRPRRGCLFAAAAAPALPTCCGRQAAVLLLAAAVPKH